MFGFALAIPAKAEQFKAEGCGNELLAQSSQVDRCVQTCNLDEYDCRRKTGMDSMCKQIRKQCEKTCY
jgi:hypothetical protein